MQFPWLKQGAFRFGKWTGGNVCLLISLVMARAWRLVIKSTRAIIGPILWGHSGPLCHALSLLLSLSSLSWTSMRRRRATVATPGEWQCKTARSGEWAQHCSNASCFIICSLKGRPTTVVGRRIKGPVYIPLKLLSIDTYNYTKYVISVGYCTFRMVDCCGHTGT